MSLRRENAIDFWRGFALVTIFVNHVPGIAFEALTHRNFGPSDSAELFVFLAGWSLRSLAANPDDPLTMKRMILRVGARGVTLYAAQILITMLAIALLAAASLWAENPLLLEWHNAAAVFTDPVRTNVALVLMSHQLGYFNILPLYVLLMMGAVVLAVVYRLTPYLVLPGALAVYLAVLMIRWNVPTWPVEGEWFFNPLSWQLIYILGFLCAGVAGPGGFVTRNRRWLRLVGIAGVVAGYALYQLPEWPAQTDWPAPWLYFTLLDKAYCAPPRLIHALCLFAACMGLYDAVFSRFSLLSRYFCLMGRNSLYVFCLGSLLSLCGQLARFFFGGGKPVDAGVLLFGLIGMGVTAWVSESLLRLREGSRGQQPR